MQKYRRILREREKDCDSTTFIATYDSRKARKDSHDRDVLIERLQKKLGKKNEISVEKLIANRGSSRYLKAIQPEGSGQAAYELDEEQIQNDSLYDGLHGIETDVPMDNEQDIERAIAAYGNLWKIEENFRVSKSDLKIRPIFHWTEQRIHSHIAICFLALLMSRYLQMKLQTKRGISMSLQEIAKSLLGEQAALIRDTLGKKIYRFPRRPSAKALDIYKTLGIPRSSAITEITSLSNFRRKIPHCDDSSIATRELEE